MKTEDVLALKQQLKAEYDADTQAVERVLQLLQARNGKLEVPASQQPTTSKTVEQRVREAIAVLPAQFTLADVAAKMTEMLPNVEFNRATVGSIVFRMKEDTKLRLIQAGIGRRAAIYGKI